jgi:hypothetical protein
MNADLELSSESNLMRSALDGRLAAYLAAGGALAMGLASPSEAVVIGNNNVIPFGINGSVPIDLNADGEIDFEIDHDRDVNMNDFLQIDKNDQVGLALPGTNFADGGLPGSNDNHEYLTTAQGNYPIALASGDMIGPSMGLFEFQESSNYANTGFTRRANRLIDEDQGLADGAAASPPPGSANWLGLNGNVGYLGVRIDFNNTTAGVFNATGLNYGWIGVRITNAADGTGEVVGYGYETRPDTKILAGQVPEPGSVAMAIVGGAFLAAVVAWKKLRNLLSA